eukprot:2699399-Rhodomonas_salina.1
MCIAAAAGVSEGGGETGREGGREAPLYGVQAQDWKREFRVSGLGFRVSRLDLKTLAQFRNRAAPLCVTWRTSGSWLPTHAPCRPGSSIFSSVPGAYRVHSRNSALVPAGA